MKKIENHRYFYIDTDAALILRKNLEVYTRRGKKVIINSVCLLQKKRADVVKGTPVLSFGAFLFRFPCLFANDYQETVNRVIALDHQLLPAIPQGIN
jgi:hypothetical protein